MQAASASPPAPHSEAAVESELAALERQHASHQAKVCVWCVWCGVWCVVVVGGGGRGTMP